MTTTRENPRIEPSDSIRDVLRRYPHLAAVLERHGLGGCGGSEGPDERLDLFAAVHRVELEALLAELRREASGPATPPREERAEEPALYRRFLVAALVATMTLGATFGAYNLVGFHLALVPASPSHNWTHATFQVFGFVFLFIAGVSMHALPRFHGTPLARPRLARAVFPLAIAGLLARTYGYLEGLVPGTIAALVLGSVLMTAAIGAWAITLAATRPRGPLELYERFLGAGVLGWLGAGACLLGGAARAVLEGDAVAASRWNEPFYLAALLGGTLAWIQGMLLRTGPGLLGLAPSRPRLLQAALVLGLVAPVLTVAATIGRDLPFAHVARDAGILASVLGLAAFAAGARALEAKGGPGARDKDLHRGMGVAWAGAALYAVLGTWYAVSDLVHRPGYSLIWDGARHAFALGFVTVAIFAIAGRIVPVFTGAAARWPRLRMTGIGLIGIGVLLRAVQTLTGLPGDTSFLFWISGFSGVVAASGVLLASASILGTLLARPRSRLVPLWVPIEPETNVAALIAAHEEALSVLVKLGFAPLANPVLRHTLARGVDLATACRLKNLDADEVATRLRHACRDGHAGALSPLRRPG